MDVASLLDEIEAGRIEPAYLLHGAERFLIDRAVEMLRRRVSQGPMAELNFSRLHGGEASGAEISAEARAVPMMADRRMVLVEDGEKLTAKDLEALDEYLADPAPQCCLVITASRLDMRRGPLARAGRRKQVHRAESLKESEVVPFVRSRAAAREIRLTPEAAAAIASSVGTDCAALDDAVERVGLFAGPEREAGEEEVALVVSPVRQRSVFALVDAIGNRRADQALSLLGELLARREEPLRLNALLARHVRQLLLARVHLHLGTGTGALPGLLGVPPFVARKLTGQCRRFRGAELEAALSRLALLDLDLKSRRRRGELLITEAVLDLIEPA
jgi:DNA polymerase III subunit delta